MIFYVVVDVEQPAGAAEAVVHVQLPAPRQQQHRPLQHGGPNQQHQQQIQGKWVAAKQRL